MYPQRLFQQYNLTKFSTMTRHLGRREVLTRIRSLALLMRSILIVINVIISDKVGH